MRRLWTIYNMTHGVILALLAESPPMETGLDISGGPMARGHPKLGSSHLIFAN